MGALRAGDLDVVVATQRPRGRELAAEKLMTESFVLVGPPDLEVPSGLGEVSDEATVATWGQWLAGLPWVSYGPDLPVVRRVWRGAFGVRPPFEPSLVAPDLLTVCEAVAAGAGVSAVPDYLCAGALAAGRVRALPMLAPLATNDLFTVVRAGDRGRPAVEAVVAGLQRAAGGLPWQPWWGSRTSDGYRQRGENLF